MKFYDIHGILSIKSDVPIPKFSYFEIEKMDDTDLSFIKGDVELSRCLKVKDLGSQKMAVDGSSLIVDYMIGRARVSINYDEGEIIFTHAYSRLGGIEKLAESMMFTKLVERDFGIITAAGLDVKGKGIAICGPHKFGKSYVAMNLQADAFLSDSMLIIDKQGNAYSYPENIDIPPNVPAKNVKLTKVQRLKLWLYGLISKSPALEDIRERIVGDRIRITVYPCESLKMEIKDKCPVKSIYLLGLGNGNLRKLKEPLLTKLVERHIIGGFGFYDHHLIIPYSYLFLDHKGIIDKNYCIVEEFAKHAEIYEADSSNMDKVIKEISENEGLTCSV